LDRRIYESETGLQYLEDYNGICEISNIGADDLFQARKED